MKLNQLLLDLNTLQFALRLSLCIAFAMTVGKRTVLGLDVLVQTPKFHSILQGKETNTFARMKTQITDIETQIDCLGNAVIKEKGYTLFIDKYNELANGVRPTARQLFDALITELTEKGKGDTLIRLKLSDYMDLRGLRDVKDARKQVREDLKALDNIHFRIDGTNKWNKGDYLDIKVSGGTSGIAHGVILFRFNQDFYNLLKSYPIMPYTRELFTINTKANPHSWHLLRKVSELKNMNIGKPTEDIISVKTLLEATPMLPSHEEVKKTSKWRERIIEPFIRDMNAITSFTWRFCGKNGVEIEKPESYVAFAAANIKVTWISYPDQSKRIAIKAQKPNGKKRTNKGATRW